MFRRQAYYIASAAFVLLWIVYFIASIHQPFVGLGLEMVGEQWMVTSSNPNGEGYHAGIRVGDLILKINDQDSGKYRFVQKWGEAEGASTIEVQKSDQPTNSIMKIPESTVLLRSFSEIPMVVLGFSFWILGFITWYKRSFLLQARTLFWLNWLIGLAIILAPASSRDLLFARELEYIILSLVPMFLIEFVSALPSGNKNQVNQFVRLLLAFIFVIILSLTILQSAGIAHCISLLRKLVLSNMILGILLALWKLGELIRFPRDKPERNQASIVLLGMAIGFLPIVLLTAVPVIVGFQPLVYTQVSYLFVSIVPVTWYYVIVNKYLPDSRRLLEAIISFFAEGIILSVVVSCVLFISKVVKALNLEVYLAALSLTMLFMVCLSVIRVVKRKILEKCSFFKGQKDFRKRVLRLNESLTSINDEDRILEEVVKSLSIEGAFIIVEDGKGGYLKKALGRLLEKPSQQAELEEFFQADQRINLKAKILPESFSAEIYIPVVSDDFSCGIFLGHRYSHVKFELDELPLITLISSQLAQRLITTFVIQELSKEIKFMVQKSQETQRRNLGLQGITTALFRGLEKERKLVAFEIHDGPLQLGLDLNRYLKYLIEECLTNNDNKTVKAISHMRKLVENLNLELRLISNDLRPPSLTDLGLLTAVEFMCEEIMLKELLLISLETVGISRDEHFKEEVELTAYRFLQEGITNAVKHSDSNKLKIHIERNESNLELMVSDLGKGFDTSKIEDWALTGAHFGLVGMKERIESLGGELQISSEIQRGTMLKATIPVE